MIGWKLELNKYQENSDHKRSLDFSIFSLVSGKSLLLSLAARNLGPGDTYMRQKLKCIVLRSRYIFLRMTYWGLSQYFSTAMASAMVSMSCR